MKRELMISSNLRSSIQSIVVQSRAENWFHQL